MNRLKEVRVKKNVSMNELAKMTDVNASQIHRYENGQKLTEDMIVRICKALQVKADYLLGLIDDEEEKK